MRHRSRAMLGPIMQGLLTVGLCVLAASAQQPAATPVSATASRTSNDAKAKDPAQPAMAPAADQSAAAPQAPAGTQADPAQNDTGVANPEPVTPAAGDAGAAPAQAEDVPAGQGTNGSVLQEGAKENRYSPDQPPPPVAPELDSNKPAPPDAAPTSEAPAAQQTAPAPETNPPAQSAPTPAPDANAPQQTAPAAPDNSAQPPTQDSAPSQPPAPASGTPETNPPAQQAPSTPDPDANAPQQTTPATPDNSAQPPAQTPASPAPDANTAAPQQTVPAAPENNSGAPSADTNTQAPAATEPASASQDQATPPPAPDNQAINPSLPAPQVNEPEPPPASRVDIFGGYAYLRPSGKVGTWSFPSQNTRGYIASGTYFFNRHIGVQAEFSHDEYPLGTTGTSPAPPYVQLGGVTDSFYTAEAGVVYRFFWGQHLVPFVHFTGGGAKVAGPKFQPPTWGYGFSGGGGVDVLLPHTGEHVAFRLVQADYGYMHADQGALQPYDLAGGTQDVNALRLSAGLVFRFGAMNPIQAKSLACDATPAEVYAGERVTLAATLRNYKDKTKHPFVFTWVLTGGKQQGFGPVIFVDTTGLAAGTYHATAHIAAKEKGRQFAQCSANFTVKPSPAPTLKCSPDPSTVTPGQVSVITAYAASIPQRQLTYTYKTSEGQINGKDNTADLHTDGLPPGVATVTCQVQDDLGQTAVATTEVTIAPPSLPPAPKAQPLCTVYFNRDMRRPTRVDNEGRACLDDIALTLEHQPDARLVLVGEHSDSEADGQLTAAERAINTRAYLANEKGIDPARVDVRTSTTSGRQVQTWLLAPGAIFDQPTEGRIDESKIKIHGQQYARQKMRRPQKGPVGEGVSHPPKN